MSDWWSRKLSGDKTRQASPDPARSYPQYSEPDTPQVPAQVTHTRSQGVCPGCSSDNYFAMGTNQPRCYDCGYPVVQQSSGMTGNGDGGPATPARQVPSSGYQPTNTSAGKIQ